MSKLLKILVSEHAGATMVEKQANKVVAGKGMVGDRYYTESGTFSAKLAGKPDKELTLIEQEKIDAFNAEYGFNYQAQDFRRNLVCAGVDLNDLVGKEFSVGEVQLLGVRLCEPCGHLAEQLDAAILRGLAHKAGLRAQVLSDGEIQVGDSVSVRKGI